MTLWLESVLLRTAEETPGIISPTNLVSWMLDEAARMDLNHDGKKGVAVVSVDDEDAITLTPAGLRYFLKQFTENSMRNATLEQVKLLLNALPGIEV